MTEQLGAAPSLPTATPERGRGTQRGMPGSFLGRAKQGSEWVGVTCAGSEGTGHCLCWERLCWGVGVCAGVCGGVYICVCLCGYVWGVCVRVQVYMCVYVCGCVCMWAGMCVYVCVCICMSVCVFVEELEYRSGPTFPGG